jgi:hypothetical protein
MKRLTFAILTGLLFVFQAVSSEKQAMVPETLWEFGRVGGMQVSPDGTQVLFTITNYDVETNRAGRDIYIIPVAWWTTPQSYQQP